MFSSIMQIFSVLKGLLDLWSYFKNFLNEQAIKQAEEKRQRREQAIEDAKNAKTPQEAFDAQKRITDNEP